jgi:TonB family protein
MFRKVVLYFIFVFVLNGFAFAQAQSEKLQVLSKPQVIYTDKARKKNVQGTVYLEVTFLASGEIGDVVYLSETSEKKKLTKYGLTERAIEAAKKIKFIPAKENGVPVTIKKTVAYTFTIYKDVPST